jgi:hypothetical protein
VIGYRIVDPDLKYAFEQNNSLKYKIHCKIRRNYENRVSPIPSIFEKFSENRKNSVEMHLRRRRNSEIGGTDKSAGLTDKSVDFLENRCGDFRTGFAEN